MFFRSADKNDFCVLVFFLAFSSSIIYLSLQVRNTYEMRELEWFYIVNFLYLSFVLGQLSLHIFSNSVLSFIEKKVFPLLLLFLLLLPARVFDILGGWFLWVDDILLLGYFITVVAFFISNLLKNRELIFIAPLHCIFSYLLAMVFFVLFNRYMSANLFGAEYLDLGYLQHDPLMFSALSTMVAKFNVSSLGIDAFAPISYHFFALALIGKISHLSEVRSIYGLFVTTQVFFFPVFLFALVAVSRYVCKYLSADIFWLKKGGAGLSLLWIAVAFIILSLVDYMDPWKSYISSETAYVGISLAFFSVFVMIHNIKKLAEDKIILLFLFISVFMVVLTKPPVGVFLLFFISYLYARLSYGQARWLVANVKVFGIGFLAIILAYPLVNNPFQSLQVSLLKMFNSTATYPAVAFALKMLLGLSLIFLVVFLNRNRLGKLFIVCECLMLLSILSIAIPLVVDVAGGSGYYIFQPILMTSALVMLSSLTFLMLKHFSASLNGIKLNFVLHTTASVMLLMTFWLFSYQVGYQYDLLNRYASGLINSIGNSGTDGYTGNNINVYVESTNQGRWIKSLREFLQDNNVGLSNTITGVFVEKDSNIFWKYAPSCKLAPLFLPGLVGLPLVGAREDADRCWYWPEYYTKSFDGDDVCQLIEGGPLKQIISVSDNSFSIKDCT
ncbi:hypothetical protein [Spartinivicinus poritis]|uniref:Uncharacterized protein n=1 Tax=Spartinivicinus poritis TaxID=2994640 RepID=A0ABT5U9N1_9GAMM|nr:hypothetical protein [Spartinivicinus sp. A2-2]MDE1462267.1 hypothetical protein [Spartinivicinus sp. A2-2]